ncbi:aspartyl protease family protein [Segetibacter sp.]|jgi:predicted aspartyl protease|uniref:aspartyl protease family protein n=1 Tax=Segetibacter sp. TaxID=2231182 RepID=UPI00263525AA|nr:aspartyl protease family protein [Segetibacter sp.]MCW3081677.1 hypothetical protein [Segetibacter sp.]
MIRTGLKRGLFHRLACFSAAILFISLSANSTDTDSQKANLLTKFSFTITNRGIIIIKGQLGVFTDSLNFILDTGSGGISLDSATARQFNLNPTTSGSTLKGLSQTKTAEFIFNQQLRLPRLHINNLDFHVNDYSFLTEAHNLKIHGVIGYSFLKSYIVKLDYEHLTIEVWKPGNITYPKDGYIIKTHANKLAAIEATVNDNRKIDSKFYFDTGADMCFLLSDKFVKDSNVLANNKKIFSSGAEGLGGKKEMMLTTVDEIQIGPYLLKKVPAYIFDDTHNVSNYPATGGIIGNELMERFNVIINYPADEIHIVPNSMFNNPFDYSYVGCSLLMENGKTIIKDIVKDSPAYVAGLKDNDIIYGINNNFKNDIEEYKTLLSKTGAKLKVFLLRGNQVTSTVVEVKSIL